MSPLLPLVAALLLSAPVQAAGRPCAYNTEQRDIPAGSPECSALLKMAATFTRLTAIAGFKRAELRLNDVVVDSMHFNAFYDSQRHEVTMLWGFVACTLTHESAGPWVLAHEIGHAVQDREGVREQEMEWKMLSGSREGATAVNRRYEAQADIIAGDLLTKAGINVDTGLTTASIFRDCVGSDAYISPGSHPAPNARVVEALHSAAQRQRELSEKLPGAIRPFDAQGDPGGVPDPASRNGYALASGRYKPRVSLEELNAQGRTTKGLVTNKDIPLPDQQLKLSNHSVTLAPGVVWRPPYTLMNIYSPDEVVAAITHAQFPDKVEFKEKVAAGVAFIVKYQLWSLLPGVVKVKDPAMKPKDS